MSHSPDADETVGADSDDGAPNRGAVVYRLADACTADALEEGNHYHATVNGVVEYGVFVDVSGGVSGLVHDSELRGDHDVGDELVVELIEVRENGDLAFAERDPDDYTTEDVTAGIDAAVRDLDAHVGDLVNVEGVVVQIKQTGGPTLFHLADGEAVVPAAAFESAGVRAYPAVEVGDAVRVTGEAEHRQEALQIEVDELSRLRGEAGAEVSGAYEERLAEAAEPPEVEPLIDWPAFEPIHEDLREVARHLRRAALSNRPIRMRHHADGDGMCASVPLQAALERLITASHADAEAARHLLKRLPSKAPFYEMEDVTRDLNFALEDRERHGQKLPLLCMLDNGSTEEDVPAYRAMAQYDVPIVVVDHHHPDPEAVEPLLDAHVNPYLHGEDYRITTGMMGVELARLVDPSITDEIRHIPAVGGLSDRSEADAMDDYLALAAEEGYDEADLRDVGEALDYAAHWLRYNDGSGFVNDLLDVAAEGDRHEEIVAFMSERAQRDVERQLKDALPHVEQERLANDARLYRLDVDEHAHRFIYPAPGKTTGKVHDRKVKETGDPVITIGYGPDFAVLRSDGVRLDIPEMVTELTEELPGAGVSGGGHLVVGSIKFVPGKRAEVLDALIEKMADAELDEALRSTLVRED
ncbi:RecJ like exonuclease [Haloglomus irregulare]|uniref:RecJ like exonuclease n=1 Tax=Haloglomus irregulare TaxID=2234134 RepID=A0A554NER7_9EURY|nr:OB-fold nucleic acid binding domain-containing protein [Haloglomus irregulare]TSD15881.1 RecJ like exonuclease [Haloglomus irregulare]